jgi:hypothetical protein
MSYLHYETEPKKKPQNSPQKLVPKIVTVLVLHDFSFSNLENKNDFLVVSKKKAEAL